MKKLTEEQETGEYFWDNFTLVLAV